MSRSRTLGIVAVIAVAAIVMCAAIVVLHPENGNDGGGSDSGPTPPTMTWSYTTATVSDPQDRADGQGTVTAKTAYQAAMQDQGIYYQFDGSFTWVSYTVTWTVSETDDTSKHYSGWYGIGGLSMSGTDIDEQGHSHSVRYNLHSFMDYTWSAVSADYAIYHDASANGELSPGESYTCTLILPVHDGAGLTLTYPADGWVQGI